MYLSTKLGIRSASEYEEPYFLSHDGGLTDLDDWIFSNLEDKNRMIIGELTLDPVTDTLSWTDLKMVSPLETGDITILADSETMTDGDFAYVVVPRPYQSTTLEITVAAPPLTIDQDIVPLAYRSGDELFVICGKTNTSGGGIDGDGIVFIDEVGGSDVDGDGSSVKPWASLVKACTETPEPTDYAEYAKPITYNLAPGTYSGTATLPHRLNISIVGHNVTYTGDINWYYNRSYEFSEPLPGDLKLIMQAAPFRTFIFTGTLNTKNEAPESGYLSTRFFFSKGIPIVYGLLNRQSGSADGPTGDLRCVLQDSRLTNELLYVAPKVWGGETETVGPTAYRNSLVIQARNCETFVFYYGNITFNNMDYCYLVGDIDYSINPVTLATGYAGAIGTKYGTGFNTTIMEGATGKFGWNGSGYDDPVQVAFDGFSYYFNSWFITFTNIVTVFFEDAQILPVYTPSFSGFLDGIETVHEALLLIDEFGSVNTGYRVYHVDDNYGGDDTDHDGSINRPYQSLPYACAQVPAPTSISEWAEIAVFVLGPGTYTDNVTLPARQTVCITGRNAIYEGDITWTYDKDNWFGYTTAYFPHTLQLNSSDDGALVITGDIITYNAEPTNGVVDGRRIFMHRIPFHFSLQNRASGGTSPGEQTGQLDVYADSCFEVIPWIILAPIKDWGGLYEPSISGEPNHIVMHMNNCQLHMNIGGCSILYANNCIIEEDIDYWINPQTGASSYDGSVGGRLMNTYVNGSPGIYFGWDGANPEDPGDIGVDSNTYYELDNAGATLDNVVYNLLDKAAGIEIDEASFGGILNGDADLQTALNDIDDRFSASVQDVTTDAATHTMESISVPSNSVLQVEAVLIAWNADTPGECRSWKAIGVALNNAGTTSLIASDIISDEATAIGDESSWGLAFTANDTTDTLNVRITGDTASDEILWQLQYEVNLLLGP